MSTDSIHRVYFIGAGGIGMSALARYFNLAGKEVAGYDLTQTTLTKRLVDEGIDISFDDDAATIPSSFLEKKSKDEILVVYTPAIPPGNQIFGYFAGNGYNIVKRSKLLGMLFNDQKGIAVAGTHGKTSVSTLIAWLLSQSQVRCTAFLGGISKNFSSNLIMADPAEYMVVEADEYDRSFLQLRPDIAVITSMDPDHLDIYGSFEEMKGGFLDFVRQVKRGGTLIYKNGLSLGSAISEDVGSFSYGLAVGADYYAANIRITNDGLPLFDLHLPGAEYKDLKLGVPGRFNVENAVAAMAVATIAGASENELRRGLESFKGIYRRFDIIINTPGCVLIDDYAHHPAELRACISAVRDNFPGRKITGIFQPHLYSRTRDLAQEFADSLEELDELVLLDIYPAREEPLPGVSSELIYNRIRMKDKILCTRQQMTEIVAARDTEVVVALGAGNIDAMVEPLMEALLNKMKSSL